MPRIGIVQPRPHDILGIGSILDAHPTTELDVLILPLLRYHGAHGIAEVISLLQSHTITQHTSQVIAIFAESAGHSGCAVSKDGKVQPLRRKAVLGIGSWKIAIVPYFPLEQHPLEEWEPRPDAVIVLDHHVKPTGEAATSDEAIRGAVTRHMATLGLHPNADVLAVKHWIGILRQASREEFIFAVSNCAGPCDGLVGSSVAGYLPSSNAASRLTPTIFDSLGRDPGLLVMDLMDARPTPLEDMDPASIGNKPERRGHLAPPPTPRSLLPPPSVEPPSSPRNGSEETFQEEGSTGDGLGEGGSGKNGFGKGGLGEKGNGEQRLGGVTRDGGAEEIEVTPTTGIETLVTRTLFMSDLEEMVSQASLTG